MNYQVVLETRQGELEFSTFSDLIVAKEYAQQALERYPDNYVSATVADEEGNFICEFNENGECLGDCKEDVTAELPPQKFQVIITDKLGELYINDLFGLEQAEQLIESSLNYNMPHAELYSEESELLESYDFVNGKIINRK